MIEKNDLFKSLNISLKTPLVIITNLNSINYLSKLKLIDFVFEGRF